MANGIDLSGKRFGRLVVTCEAPPYIGPNGKRARKWQCKCDCGKTVSIVQSNLNRGVAKSCGCIRIEKLIERSTTHGNASRRSVSPEYRAWSTIIRRCTDVNHARYADYGGRGIKVLWGSFEEFLLSMGKRPTDDHSIDRIDVNGHYCSENCRWASSKEQSRNKRDTQWVEWKGQRKSLADWAEEVGISHSTLYYRIVTHEWPVEIAMTTVPQSEPKSPRIIEWRGKCQGLPDWARELSVNYKVLANRIYRRKWPIERAFTTPVMPPGKHPRRTAR